MISKKTLKKTDTKSFYTQAVNRWAMLTFFVLPLIVTNKYFNILKTKTITFTLLTLGLLVVLAVNGFVEGDINLKAIKKTFRFSKDNIANLSITAFVITAAVSTLTAGDYILQAFLGNEGRYNGLQLCLVYFFAYITVSKYFRFDMKVFDAFIISGLLVSLFGISDYFDLDIFDFKSGMLTEQQNIFTSTIGNINTYTAFLALFISLVMCLFIFSETDFKNKDGSLNRSIYYYICMFIGFIAITMGNSDNGYLTLGALFGFVPFFAFKKKSALLKYFISLAAYFTSIWIVSVINVAFADTVIGISGLYNIISSFKYLYLVVIFMWALVAVIYRLVMPAKFDYDKVSHIFVFVWLFLIIAGVLGVAAIVYIINKSPEPGKYGTLSEYAIFSDAWGSYRGYIWRATVEEFNNLDIVHKLFGTGPDTFGIYMDKLRYEDMMIKTGQYYDAAHNEYLHYLYTHGILGLVSYLVFIISVIYMGFKRVIKDKDISSPKNVVLLGLTYGVLAYATQASVNINIPIASAFFFMFIMLVGALAGE